MAFVGSLTCRDCGLTFTSRWGSVDGAFEFRCDEQDHVVFVHAETGEVISVDGSSAVGGSLIELRGLCPACHSELSSGRLPCCPICGSRDHDVEAQGTLA